MGRVAELGLLRDALERLGRDPDTGLTAVALVGEPGIGKTRLLTELTRLAAERGIVAWWPRIEEFRRADLLAERGPGLVLVLDDLHRADEAAIRLLGRLLRNPPEGRVLLAFAYRPRQAPAGLLSAVAEARTVRQVDLRPLTLREAEELVGRCPELWSIFRESGGNPCYLRLLAGRDCSGGCREETVPVEPALVTELAAIGPTARRVAWAVAVLAEPSDPALLAEVADLSLPDVLDALDELGRADIIRAVDGTSVVSFRHPVVGQVVYQVADPGWRHAAHKRADLALAARDAGKIIRAHHVVRTAAPGNLDAVRVLGEAAWAVRLRSPDRAARWFRAALRLLPDESAAAAEHRPRLMLGLARALALSGRLVESRDTLHAVLRLPPDDPDPLRKRAIRWCGTIDRLLGRHEESHARLVDAVSTRPERDGMESAALRLELAAGELMRGRLAAGLGWGEEALRAFQRLGDPIAEATALGILGMGSCFASGHGTDRAGSVARVDRAASVIDAAVDTQLTERMETVVWVAWSEILHERLPDALRHLERGLRLVEHAEGRFMLPHLLAARVMALAEHGQLDRARLCCDQALDGGFVSGVDDPYVITLATRCRVAAWVGGNRDAQTLGEAAVARPASEYVRALAARTLAESRLVAGDPAGCLAMVEQVGGAELPGVEAWTRPDWYELLTRAELTHKRFDAAGIWAGRALVAAGQLGLPGRHGLAALAGAQVLGTFDPGAAVPSALAAATALGSAGLRLEAARARLVAGSLLAAAGERDRARAELTVARAAAEECGAKRLVRLAVGEARRLAARSARHRGSGPAPLTQREHEVAGLLGEGLTNRQIAGRLFVTEKTVEMHVSRIFAKLGVATRAAVAGKIARDT